MQLDADEDGEPFFKPPALTSTPIRHGESRQQGSERRAEQLSDSEQNKETDRNSAAPQATGLVGSED